MATMIHDPLLEERLHNERAATGADRYDEIWESVYMMAPMPNNEHQYLVGRLTRVLDEIVTDNELGQVFPGANVSDRCENWEQNYRVPDIAVFLHDSAAVNRGSFWFGGPDLGVEIVSQEDQTREKLEFYGAVGTRELLIVDRDPWRLELYRLQGNQMDLDQTVTPGDGNSIDNQTVGMTVALEAAERRPRIRVCHTQTGKIWTI